MNRRMFLRAAAAAAVGIVTQPLLTATPRRRTWTYVRRIYTTADAKAWTDHVNTVQPTLVEPSGPLIPIRVDNYIRPWPRRTADAHVVMSPYSGPDFDGPWYLEDGNGHNCPLLTPPKRKGSK